MHGTMKFASAGILIMLLAACSEQGGGGMGMGGMPPAEVSVVTIAKQDVTLTAELPGRAVAYRKAELRPQVSGIIDKRLFTEGSEVEAGQQMYQIDPARYEAAVQNAKAGLARAKANLTTTQAREARYRGLLKDKAISQQTYDDALSEFEQAKADVAVNEAALNTAEINLRYTRVNAPISGRIGKSSVTDGALVTEQQTNVLATIYQLDPIYVDVSQSARDILNLRRQFKEGTLNQQEAAKVQLVLEDGSVYEQEGTLQFSDMSVNETTGTVVLRALFPNPDSLILPGIFVRAKVQLGTREEGVLVPQRAVTRDRSGNASVYVVNKDNVVELRPLVVSRTVESDWLVEDGLAEGDRVVVSGLQKIAPGAQVSVAAPPSNTETAKTEDQTEIAGG
ncbi:Toluene efflux pump periplasmic linker protein TtgA [Thalassocella blandensis]|nr:Toluene efflux pump periplasmic linker protein TtgA [Thalassocella blandensis]